MNVDSRLLANMIAHGIQAGGEQLGEPFEVTINESVATVYVATRDRRLFRIRVEALSSPKRTQCEEGPGA